MSHYNYSNKSVSWCIKEAKKVLVPSEELWVLEVFRDISQEESINFPQAHLEVCYNAGRLMIDIY